MFFHKGKQPSGAWGVILNATTIGLHLVAATFIGLAVGYYLDKWLGTKPWLTIVMLILGVAAGFKNVYEEVQRIQNYERKSSGRDSGKD